MDSPVAESAAEAEATVDSPVAESEAEAEAEAAVDSSVAESEAEAAVMEQVFTRLVFLYSLTSVDLEKPPFVNGRAGRMWHKTTSSSRSNHWKGSCYEGMFNFYESLAISLSLQ